MYTHIYTRAYDIFRNIIRKLICQHQIDDKKIELHSLRYYDQCRDIFACNNGRPLQITIQYRTYDPMVNAKD